jgi:uncharacterized OsmC-like protein
MDVRALQAPLKEGYRADPASSRITLRAVGAAGGTPVACSVEVGRAIHAAEAHPGVGGPGGAACSGDLLLGALAACAQVTCQMVAAARGLPVRSVAVTVEGDLDLQGTLGTRRDVPVGFEEIRLRFDLDAPGLSDEDRAALATTTERYCVVMRTLLDPPRVTSDWSG